MVHASQHASQPGETPEHGKHTLKVWRGSVVATFGDDVFIELGPRMQGVCSLRTFKRPPDPGDVYDFTLRGLEAGLWSVALATEDTLQAWDDMEVGALVQAKVVREAPGGLEVKIGRLHGFMPRSHCGVPREEKVTPLVGRVLPCEVIEVDAQRQRVVVSRRLTQQKERTDERVREAERLKVGAVITGRVVRIEEYGVFVAFGHGLEGLVHVSNLAHARIAHPCQVVTVGQSLEAKILSIKHGGRRIGLGVKQLQESPWVSLERTVHAGQVLEGVVVRVTSFGAFVSVAGGVEGLVPLEECGLERGRQLSNVLDSGSEVVVRVVSFDLAAQRLGLSLRHAAGGVLTRDDLADRTSWVGLAAQTEIRAETDAGTGARRGTAAQAEPVRFPQHSQSVERLIAAAKRRPRAS